MKFFSYILAEIKQDKFLLLNTILTLMLLLYICMNCFDIYQLYSWLPDSTEYIDQLQTQIQGDEFANPFCMLHQMDLDSETYLLYLNTGTAYNIDVYGNEPHDLALYDFTISTNGKDTHTGANHSCTQYLDAGYSKTSLKNIAKVSLDVDYMNTLYCSNCIRKLLTAVKGHAVPCVIVDPTTDTIYPLNWGVIKTAHYKVKITPRKDHVVSIIVKER